MLTDRTEIAGLSSQMLGDLIAEEVAVRLLLGGLLLVPYHHFHSRYDCT